MKLWLLSIALALLVSTESVSAQTLLNYGNSGCNFREGTITATCIPTYIAFVISQVFMLTGALSLIMIMIGGFEYTLDKLIGGKEKGIKHIQHGIGGMIVSGLAFFIVNFAVAALKG